jgi:hypothetical protein
MIAAKIGFASSKVRTERARKACRNARWLLLYWVSSSSAISAKPESLVEVGFTCRCKSHTTFWCLRRVASNVRWPGYLFVFTSHQFIIDFVSHPTSGELALYFLQSYRRFTKMELQRSSTRQFYNVLLEPSRFSLFEHPIKLRHLFMTCLCSHRQDRSADRAHLPPVANPLFTSPHIQPTSDLSP